MNKRDSMLTFGFISESGVNKAALLLNPESQLLCPTCFESYVVKHTGNVDAELYNSYQIATGENAVDLNFAPKIEYCCTCKQCGETVTLIQVDWDLADAIRILNRNGYTTVAHCQGHSGDTVRRMYIKFERGMAPSSVPYDWEYCPTDNSIEFKYTIELQFQQGLSNLYDWVKEISTEE